MSETPTGAGEYDPHAVNKAIRAQLKLSEQDTRFFGPAAPPHLRRQDPRWYTATNVFLEDGLIVVDYDMVVHRFSWAEQEKRASLDSQYWDGWFYVDGSSMNGERLGTIDPFTRLVLTEQDAVRGTLPPRNR